MSPALWLSVAEARRLSQAGSWAVAWLVENRGLEEIAIEESWLPHGQFRAGRLTLTPPLVLRSGESVLHIREVAVLAAAGEQVENAFLILRVRHGGNSWRIFIRTSVESGEDDGLRPIVENITADLVRG